VLEISKLVGVFKRPLLVLYEPTSSGLSTVHQSSDWTFGSRFPAALAVFTNINIDLITNSFTQFDGRSPHYYY
jgi:hypothetical protein